MRHASIKTLTLLMGLLAVVVILQFGVSLPTAKASVIWLDDEPVDPNTPDEPDPQPEIAAGSKVWLDDEPVDPNTPDEPDPQPEIAAGSKVWLDDEPVDPNTPDEPDPQPEAIIAVPVA